MRTSHLKRSVSLITVFLFCFSLVPASSAQSPAAGNEAFLAPITIPSSIGTLEYSKAGSGPEIIHIQTAHGSYEAGKNIAAILAHLDQQYGFKDLFVEGAYGDLHPEVLRFFPNDTAKTLRVADELLKRGYLEGEELYLAQTPDARLFGLEDEKLYKENEAAFIEVIRQRNLAQKYLQQMDEGISRIASQYLDKNVREFLNAWRDHELERTPLSAWTQTLYDAAKRIGWDLKDPGYQFELPMLVRLYNIQEMTRGFDPAKFNAEKKKFLGEAKSKVVIPAEAGIQSQRLSASSQMKLGQTGSPIKVLGDDKLRIEALFSDHASAGSDADIKSAPKPSLSNGDKGTPLSAVEAWNIVAEMVKTLPKDFPYDSYPMVKKYIGQQLLQKELMGSALMEETVKLREKILEQLVRSDAERETVALMKDYFLLAKLFELKLTRSEFDQLRTPYSVLRTRSLPSSIAARFSEVNRSGRVRNVEFTHLADLDALYAKAMEFYRLAEERDSVMLQKLEAGMKAQGVNKAVVITGGFHADAFREHFTSAGDAYTLLTPQITSFSDRSFETYVKAIFRQAASSKQAAAGTMKQREFLSLAVKNPGVAIMAIRQIGIDQPKAFPGLAALPRSESRDLSRRGFIAALTGTAMTAAAPSAIADAVTGLTPAARKELLTDQAIKDEVKKLFALIKESPAKLSPSTLKKDPATFLTNLTDLLRGLVRLGELEKQYDLGAVNRNDFKQFYKPTVSRALNASAAIIKADGLSLIKSVVLVNDKGEKKDVRFDDVLFALLEHLPSDDRNKKNVFASVFGTLEVKVPIPDDESKLKHTVARHIMSSKDAVQINLLFHKVDSPEWRPFVRAVAIEEAASLYKKNNLDELTASLIKSALEKKGKICSAVLLIMTSNQDAEERGSVIKSMLIFGNLQAALILVESSKKLGGSPLVEQSLKAIISIASKLSPEDKTQLRQAVDELKLKGSISNNLLNDLKSQLLSNSPVTRSEVRESSSEFVTITNLAGGIIPLAFVEKIQLGDLTRMGLQIRRLEETPNMKFEAHTVTEAQITEAREVLDGIRKLDRPVAVQFEGFEAIIAQNLTQREKDEAVLSVLEFMFKLRALSGDNIGFEIAPKTFKTINPLLKRAWAALLAQNSGWIPPNSANIINASPRTFVPQPDLSVIRTPTEAHLSGSVIGLDKDADGNPIVLSSRKTEGYPAEVSVATVAALLKESVVDGLRKLNNIYRISPEFSSFTRALSTLVNQAFAHQRFESAA